MRAKGRASKVSRNAQLPHSRRNRFLWERACARFRQRRRERSPGIARERAPAEAAGALVRGLLRHSSQIAGDFSAAATIETKLTAPS